MFHTSLSIASLRSDDRPFFRCLHENLSTSGRQFVSRIAHLSHAYGSQVEPGSRIILIGKTSTSYLEAFLATMDCGAVAVPINTRWSEREVAQALCLVRPSLIIADESHYLLMEKVRGSMTAPCPLIRMEISPGDQLTDNRATLQLKSHSNGAALIVFTSGTSSAPKAVLLSHSNLHTQSLAKLAQPPSIGFNDKDVYLHLAPLFHIGGVSSLLATLTAGSRQVLMPSFDPLLAIRLIAEERVTCFIAVPTIIQDLVAAAGSIKLEGIKKILVGAGGMNQRTKVAVASTFPNARLCSAYGMSEACSSIACDEIDHWPLRSGFQRLGSCVGRPAPGIEIKIDPLSQQEEGPESPAAEIAPGFKYGEVLTRGPHVMLGYYNDSEATVKAISKDGWLKTGDLGIVDENGMLWLLGRAKDVVKTGGENVLASEVEEALMSQPGIARAAVVGLPDERLGERVAALVVLEPNVRWRGPLFPSSSSPSQSPSQQESHDQGFIELTPKELQVRKMSHPLAESPP